MATDTKKAKAEPAAKSEPAAKEKATSGEVAAKTPDTSKTADAAKTPDTSKTPDAPKTVGGETAAAAPSSYSRGEGQKPVTAAYKENWNAIFAKKSKTKSTRKSNPISAKKKKR
jgi:hypothetical protein